MRGKVTTKLLLFLIGQDAPKFCSHQQKQQSHKTTPTLQPGKKEAYVLVIKMD